MSLWETAPELVSLSQALLYVSPFELKGQSGVADAAAAALGLLEFGGESRVFAKASATPKNWSI